MTLRVRDITKSYGGEAVLADIGFDVDEGEVLAILGRSGSGKSTLLKIISGLESADTGTVTWQDRDLTHLPPRERGIVYLYQEPLLFPDRDVFDNIAFGLRLKGIRGQQLKEATTRMIAELGLEGHAHKGPEEISGGQRQRVNFGRALITHPRLLALDEPLGALDTHTRHEMQTLFRRVAKQRRITVLFVTHDLREALTVGDRVARLSEGRLRIYDSRKDLIDDPDLGLAEEIAFWENFAGN